MLFFFLSCFLKYSNVVNSKKSTIVKKIEVHTPEKKHAHNSVKIDITFTAIGLFSIPEEEELLEMAKQAQAENQKLSAYHTCS